MRPMGKMPTRLLHFPATSLPRNIRYLLNDMALFRCVSSVNPYMNNVESEKVNHVIQEKLENFD